MKGLRITASDKFSVTKEINAIGPVLFQKSNKAKRIIISISPFKGIRVAIPPRCSFSQGEEFVNQKKVWVVKNIKQMHIYEQQHRAVNETLPPVNKSLAMLKLTTRLCTLAEQYGFRYNRVTIRNQKTRWGSCSPSNDISLNAKLMRLPESLIDYVLLHELLHTKIKNHGKLFWRELQKITGDAKGLAGELRAYKLMLV
jgi:predicted metal-dependent hydrolase